MTPPASSAPSQHEDDGKFRRRLLIVLGIATFGVCGGTIFGGCRLFETFVDYRPAAAELPAAVEAYRATGLPWVAKDLAPNPPVRPEENAAPLIRAAAKARGKLKLNDIDPELRDAVRAKEWEEVARGLKPWTASLALFEQAAKRPKTDFGRDYDLGPNLLLPEYAEMRAAVKLFGYRAQLRAARGDLAGAQGDLISALRLGRRAESDANLLALLVRIASDSLVYDAMQRTAAIEPRLASVLAQELAKPYPAPNFERALRGEAYMAVTITRNLHGRLSLSQRSSYDEGALPQMESDPNRIQRDGLPSGTAPRAYMARSLQIWAQAAKEMKRHRDDPVALGKAMDDLTQAAEKQRGLSHVLNSITLPVFGPAGAATVRVEAGREITLAYLRALEHRRRTGEFPKTILSGNDPFGNPYVVKRQGAGFRIYSVGANGKDEGGFAPGERPSGSKADDIGAVFPPYVGKRSAAPSRKANQTP